MSPSPSNKKKKVLALPIEEEGRSKVLLLEPGRPKRVQRTRKVPREPAEAKKTLIAQGTAEPDEPATAETAEETDDGGFSLPFGRKESEEEAEDDEEEGRSGFSLPFGRKKDEAEETEEPEPEGTLEAEPAQATEEPDEAPEVQEAPAEPGPDVTRLDLDEVALDLEEVGAALQGPSTLHIHGTDGERRITLDPIDAGPPPTPAPTPTPDEDETTEPSGPPDEPAQPEEPERPTPRLDPKQVQQIHYNVDMAIYKSARRGGPEVGSPREAVDRIVETAEAEGPSKEADRARRELPATDRSLADIPGMDASDRQRLESHGVTSLADLVRKDPVTLAVESGLKIRDLRSWQRMAELLHVPEVGPDEAQVLSQVGIHRLDVLAEQDPDDLRKRIDQFQQYRAGGDPAVTADDAARWIRSADQLRPKP